MTVLVFRDKQQCELTPQNFIKTLADCGMGCHIERNSAEPVIQFSASKDAFVKVHTGDWDYVEKVELHWNPESADPSFVDRIKSELIELGFINE